SSTESQQHVSYLVYGFREAQFVLIAMAVMLSPWSLMKQLLLALFAFVVLKLATHADSFHDDAARWFTSLPAHIVELLPFRLLQLAFGLRLCVTPPSHPRPTMRVRFQLRSLLHWVTAAASLLAIWRWDAFRFLALHKLCHLLPALLLAIAIPG